jgi:hypothetical protein
VKSAMKHRKELSVALFLVVLGCGDRSALDILGTATGLGDAGASVSGSSGGGETSSSSSGSGSSSGGASGGSGSSGGRSSSSGSTSSSGGVSLTCADSATCRGGQVCCATVNLSAGLSVTSACQARPCAAGAYQFCASSSECSGGATCKPNPLGMGPMICTGGGGTSGSSGSSSGSGTGADAALACSTPDTGRCGPDNFLVLPLTGDPVACGLSVADSPYSLCTALCHTGPNPNALQTCSLRQDAGANEVVCNCVSGPQ